MNEITKCPECGSEEIVNMDTYDRCPGCGWIQHKGRKNLTEKLADDIKRLKGEGLTQQAIADRLDCSQATVSNSLRGV